MKIPPALFSVLSFGLLLSACSFSLAVDVTPPPGSEQLPVSRMTPAAVSGPLFPLVPPDPSKGKEIYIEKCAPCHGTLGQGDGERAVQLPNPVSALGSIEVARQATPAYWFTVVSRGNIERFMPPFPSLSDRQLWDVVAYALSLSTSPGSAIKGAGLYKENCAGCHGEQGKGDGPEAGALTTPPINLTDLAFMSEKSAVDLYRRIAVGVSPVMPAFGERFSEAEIWALADFLRTLTFTAPQEEITSQEAVTSVVTTALDLTPTEVITTTQGKGSITVKVTNGSGGPMPTGLPVRLLGFDNMLVVITQTATLRVNGMYMFRDIEMVEGRAFVATVEFDQMTYGSDISVAPPNVNNIDLPITVYETTADPSIITVDRMHMFFDLLSEDTIRVVELYIMSNPTNKTLVPAGEGQTTIRFRLPVGSSGLEFDDSVLGERYLETPDGFGDTIPVRPGSGNYQVLFTFEMPYNRKLELAQPVLQPVEAVVILVPEGGIRIKSDMLSDDGLRDVQGTKYHLFSGGSLAPGEELRLTVVGQGAGGFSLGVGSRSNLNIGVGFLGFALLVAGLWFYRHARLREENDGEEHPHAIDGTSQETAETVMDAIITLDDLFQSGQLPEEAYRQRRAELKSYLKDIHDRGS